MGGMPSPAPAHSHPAADQPWPAPRAAPPTEGCGWKWAPAEMRRARQEDHLPVGVAGELNFKMSSISCLLAARAAVWAACRSGEHPARLAAVVSLPPEHVQASASAS